MVNSPNLRKKGASSLRPLDDKPGFTIKLDEYVGGQRLDGLREAPGDHQVQAQAEQGLVVAGAHHEDGAKGRLGVVQPALAAGRDGHGEHVVNSLDVHRCS